MTTYSSPHPLRYIAEALSQMAATLRDFDMPDSAALLEKAKSDIQTKLTDKKAEEASRN